MVLHVCGECSRVCSPARVFLGPQYATFARHLSHQVLHDFPGWCLLPCPSLHTFLPYPLLATSPQQNTAQSRLRHTITTQRRNTLIPSAALQHNNPPILFCLLPLLLLLLTTPRHSHSTSYFVFLLRFAAQKHPHPTDCFILLLLTTLKHSYSTCFLFLLLLLFVAAPSSFKTSHHHNAEAETHRQNYSCFFHFIPCHSIRYRIFKKAID